jgi:SOS response regulatory protein OraA/RecX
LRAAPRKAYCRRHYNNGRKYSQADAERIFERLLSRGYSPEEAAEATLAITGLRPVIRVLAGGAQKALAEEC